MFNIFIIPRAFLSLFRISCCAHYVTLSSMRERTLSTERAQNIFVAFPIYFPFFPAFRRIHGKERGASNGKFRQARDVLLPPPPLRVQMPVDMADGFVNARVSFRLHTQQNAKNFSINFFLTHVCHIFALYCVRIKSRKLRIFRHF